MRTSELLSSDLRHLRGEATYLAAGAASGLLTSSALFWIRRDSGLDLTSLTFWLVVPVGAIGAGFLAASGYYLAAIYLRERPTRTLLLNMLLLSAGTYLLVEYLSYLAATFPDGSYISTRIGFIDYFELSATHKRLTFAVRGRPVGESTGELGRMGYVVEALQFAGFLIGSLAAYVNLLDKRFCRVCRAYYKTKQVLVSQNPEALDEYVRLRGLQPLPNLVRGIRAASANRRLHSVVLYRDFCPSCGDSILRPEATVEGGTLRLPKYHVRNAQVRW